MKFATSVAFLALVLSVKAQDDGPHIETPPAVQQCAPVQLSFQGGTGPYDIAVLPQGQISAPPLVEVGSNIQGNKVTWIANVQQNTGITLRIRDANGATGFSGPIQIQASSDSGCLNGGASSGSASSGGSSGSSTTPPTSTGSASTSSSGPSSAPAPGPAPTSSSGSAPTSNRPTSSGGSASPSSSGSAPAGSQTGGGSNNNSAATSLNVGAATGLIGLLAAVVLA